MSNAKNSQTHFIMVRLNIFTKRGVMMTDKRAQAAMEFLMTYGWAILVVLVAIGALAYFGVLSPNKFLPTSCTLEPGISCDHKVEAGQTTLVLKNGLGKDITVGAISVGECSTTFNQAFASGTQATFTLTGCTNGVAGARFNQNVALNYTESESGLTRTMKGVVTGKIE